MKKILACIGVAAMLTSCTLSNDQQASAAKAYDRICTSEPQLYAAYVVVATAKGKSTAKADAFHSTITTLCTDRPTDVVSALVTLAAAYAQFVALNAKA